MRHECCYKTKAVQCAARARLHSVDTGFIPISMSSTANTYGVVNIPVTLQTAPSLFPLGPSMCSDLCSFESCCL